MNMRFLDVALSELKLQAVTGTDKVCCNASVIRYDPLLIIRLYKKNPNAVTRLYLHILLHCIFSHAYKYDKVEQELWDAAVDMAVENTVLSLNLAGMETAGDDERREVLAQWKARAGALTADRIYRSLTKDRLGVSELFALGALFKRDVHDGWTAAETLEMTVWVRLCAMGPSQ